MSHTKEPWKVDKNYSQDIYSHNGKIICLSIGQNSNNSVFNAPNKLLVSQKESDENARRIVACVNACAGIESIELGQVSYADLLESHNWYQQQHAELLAKAKKFAQAYDEEAPLFDFYLELMQAIASVESK